MSEKLGPVSYKMSDEDPFLGGQMHKSRQFSEHTMEVIDEEVHQILEIASKKALDLLKHHKDNLVAVAKSLVENEELDRHQIADLIGPSVHKEKEADLPDRPPVVLSPSDPNLPIADPQNSDPSTAKSDNAEATS
jgi:cell division protease FtsH